MEQQHPDVNQFDSLALRHFRDLLDLVSWNAPEVERVDFHNSFSNAEAHLLGTCLENNTSVRILSLSLENLTSTDELTPLLNCIRSDNEHLETVGFFLQGADPVVVGRFLAAAAARVPKVELFGLEAAHIDAFTTLMRTTDSLRDLIFRDRVGFGDDPVASRQLATAFGSN